MNIPVALVIASIVIAVAYLNKREPDRIYVVDEKHDYELIQNNALANTAWRLDNRKGILELCTYIPEKYLNYNASTVPAKLTCLKETK